LETLKVSSHSNPNSVAGAMAGVLRRQRAVEVTVVGAGALNQAIKAVAIARLHVAADGLDPVILPSFIDIEIEGAQRTGIKLEIVHRGLPDVIDLRADQPASLPVREQKAPPNTVAGS
jgi:stage V sporulation protein S